MTRADAAAAITLTRSTICVVMDSITRNVQACSIDVVDPCLSGPVLYRVSKMFLIEDTPVISPTRALAIHKLGNSAWGLNRLVNYSVREPHRVKKADANAGRQDEERPSRGARYHEERSRGWIRSCGNSRHQNSNANGTLSNSTGGVKLTTSD